MQCCRHGGLWWVAGASRVCTSILLALQAALAAASSWWKGKREGVELVQQISPVWSMLPSAVLRCVLCVSPTAPDCPVAKP